MQVTHEVKQIYAGLDHPAHAARQIRERGTGTLRVACQPSLAARLLPRANRRLAAECPGASVVCTCVASLPSCTMLLALASRELCSWYVQWAW